MKIEAQEIITHRFRVGNTCHYTSPMCSGIGRHGRLREIPVRQLWRGCRLVQGLWYQPRFQKDGSTKEHRNTIAVPRFTIGFDYKFNPKWILGAEIEFEAGGTGTAVELENNENGEYETEIEKGGEVALEQLHITRLIIPEFNVRVGHQVVPVGLTNAHHEPINFFGTIRPESQTVIMPSAWHETGLTIFGTFGSGYGVFDYEAMVVAGLNANGFDRDTWVASGKQGFLRQITSPHLNLRGAS